MDQQTQPPAVEPGKPVPDASFTGPAAPSGPAEFIRLDRRVINLWRLTDGIGLGILLVAAGGGCLVLGFGVLENGLWPLLLWSLLAALSGGVILWYPQRAYQAWGYRIDAKVLETRSGLWFRVVKLLPLSRLQHVDLHRGPLERAHGLASLVLHTAGTHDATLVIPGLDAEEAVRLRDRLVAAGGDDAV